MKRVVVTGASGHLGYHVASQLITKGYETHLLIRRENSNILRLREKGATVHVCDLMKAETYAGILKGASGAFHIAAENTTRKSNKDRVLKNTAGITRVFLKACVDAGIPKMVYTSSVVVLGRSKKKSVLIKEADRTNFIESPYVEGKIDAEKDVEALIAETSADIKRVYPSWIVGPDDPRMTPPHKIITDYFQNGQFFYFPGGISIASVESVAAGHIQALEKGEKQGSYILGGKNLTFKQFYMLLAKFSGHKKPFLRIPKWVIVLGARLTKPVFRLLGMEPLLEPSYAKSVFGNYSWYDSSKACDKIDYSPKAADEILKAAVFDARQRILATRDLGLQRTAPSPASGQEGKLLITGVPGWLGNRMVDILINGDKQGHFQQNRPVKLLVQEQYKGFLKLPDNFEIVYGDLLNRDSIEKALEGVTTVFHLAGAIYPPKIKTLYKVNYEGTQNLVDACINKGIRRVVYMGTDSIAGKGTSKKRIFDENTPSRPYKHYGKSKYLAEKYILDKTKEGKIDGTSLRGFWFFGPFAPPRNLNFVRMMTMERQIIFGNGKNYRSVSHVDNIVQAFFKAENNSNTHGKCYWICGKEDTMTVDDIYREICSRLDVEYKPLYIPVWMCRFFGMADTVLSWFGYLHPTIHAAGKFYFDIAGKIDAAKRDFDYEPMVNFEDAAEELKKLI